MAWMGNEWRPNTGEMADKEVRRRKKLARQEKRVERLNEPLFAWLCKTFRVVTVFGTLVLVGLDIYQCVSLEIENMVPRTVFTAFSAWTTFGLIWTVAALGQMFSLKKQGETDQKKIRRYLIDVVIAVAGMVILGIAAFSIT